VRTRRNPADGARSELARAPPSGDARHRAGGIPGDARDDYRAGVTPRIALLLAVLLVAAGASRTRADCPGATALPAVCIGATSAGTSRFCFGSESCDDIGVVGEVRVSGAPFAVTGVHVEGPLGSRPVAPPVVLLPGEAVVAELSGVPPGAGTTHGELVWVLGGDAERRPSRRGSDTCTVDLTVSAPACAEPRPGDPCHGETCVAGACVEGTPGGCDDGDACTTGDRCVAGRCTGRLRSCVDGFACTEDACVAGACRHTPLDARCDTGECAIAACRPGAPGSDARGCVATPSAPNGACTDDGFACTDDVCTAGGCLHVPIDSRCAPADGCTAAACAPDRADHDASGCVPGPALAGVECAEDGDPCSDDVCQAGKCLHTAAADWVLCAPVQGAYRRALALATLARQLAGATAAARVPAPNSASAVPFGATLADRLGRVAGDMDLVVRTLAGKAAGVPNAPSPPASGLAETPAQRRARLAAAVLRRTPRIVSAVVRSVASPRARTAFGRDDSRDLRRRGRLLLRGTKTLKAELKRLQRVSQTFAR